MPLYKQPALLASLAVLVSRGGSCHSLGRPLVVWSRKQVFGAVVSGPFPEIVCSGCVGEFRPECEGPESEAPVVGGASGAAQLLGDPQAQPPAGAQVCICQ